MPKKQCLWNRILQLLFDRFAEFKISFQKLKPHIVTYHDYKHCHNEKFWSDFQNCASEKNLKSFNETTSYIFNKHARIKGMMERSKLRNRFLKAKSITHRKNFHGQWNYSKRLIRSTKNHLFKIQTSAKLIIIDLSGKQ